ncbi:hypothetical protein Tco_1461557 [Tanacetum coccineum]
MTTSESPTTSIPSSTPVSRVIAPTHVDLLTPRKRFGYWSHTEDGLGMGVEIAASDIKKAKASAGGMVKVEVDPRVGPVIKEDVHDHVTADGAVEVIETAQRQLEAGQLIASGERAGLDDRIRRLGRENLKVRALLSIERDRVDSLRHHMALSQEEFCQIYRDCDDARRRFRRLESFVGSDDDNGNGGNGNGGNRNGGNRNGNHGDGGKNRNGNPNENGRGAMPVTRVCTYQDFVKYQPLHFKGTEGVIGLPDNIQGNVMSAKPTRLQDAIRLENSLMDQKLKGYAIRSAENKRKLESNQRETHVENPSFKRHNVRGSNVARAYTAGGNEGRVYAGPH